MAALFPFFLEQYDCSEPINISTSRSTSIAELAGLVKELVGYEGEITWDASKPDGKVEKIFSDRRLQSLGLDCPTSLRQGLNRTIAWFASEYEKGTVRL